MTRWIGIIVVILCLAPTCALAQNDTIITPEQLGYGYELTAGAVFPVVKDVVTTADPILGIAWYGPLEEEFGSGSALGLSADWIPLQRNDDKTVNLIPMMINYRVYGFAAGYRLFTNLGVGVRIASDDILQMRIDKGASFAWAAGFGIDITNSFFGQFKFIGGENPSQDGLAGVELGYRF